MAKTTRGMVDYLNLYPPPRNGKPVNDHFGQMQLRNRKINDLKVERHLDLHGSYVDEALKELDYFITKAARDGCKKVCVIHGKGLHSPQNQSKLKESVQNFLNRHPLVRKVEQAPHNMGGAGASCAVLRHH
jgi:DNA-nicking Smr family endonuclease